MQHSIRFALPALCLCAASIAPIAAQSPNPVPVQQPPAVCPGKPFLGVVTERASDELRHQLPALQSGSGLIVRDVMPGSPAATANIQQLDILHRWNDQLLVHPEQLRILVESSKPGDQVALGFMQQGQLVEARIRLESRPAPQPRAAHGPAMPPISGLPQLSPEMLGQAARLLGDSGIDPKAIGEAVKGLNLENIDPDALNQALKGIDFEAIGRALGELGPVAPPAAQPKPAVPAKVIIVAPDGSRTEIPLADALKPGASPAEVLSKIDLSKLDPAAILTGKVLLIQPDGTEQVLNPADLLKNGEAINRLLEGLAHPR